MLSPKAFDDYQLRLNQLLKKDIHLLLDNPDENLEEFFSQFPD